LNELRKNPSKEGMESMIKLDNKQLEGKIVAVIKPPKFDLFPLIAIAVGGDGFKRFGWTRGKCYGVLSLFGLYITFRMPYKKYDIWQQGVDDGFKATQKTISYLTSHINKQNAVIASLLANTDILDDDDEEEDEGFNPLWN
jgi:N-acetyl-beta-hexosaminidase